MERRSSLISTTMANKKIQYKAGVLGGVTQEQADKKNAELNTPTPTAPQTVPQEPTSLSQSSVAALLEANNARMAQKQAEVQAYQEAENKRVQDLQDLRAKKGSFIGNYLTAIEPKVDEKKEKRLQQAAKMKLLHDGLSALAKAYPAFIGKNAMGYYPTSTSSNIGKDIEELNAMRDAYIKERKAWQDLGERYKVAQLDEQIASAESALKTAQEAKAQAYKDLGKAEDDYLDDLRYLDEQSRADARAKSRNDATVKAAQIRATNAKKDGEKGEDDYEALNFVTSLDPDFGSTEQENERIYKRKKFGSDELDKNGVPIVDRYTTTTKKPISLTEQSLGYWNERAKRDPRYQAYLRAKKYGVSEEEIRDLVSNGIDITTYTDEDWKEFANFE